RLLIFIHLSSGKVVTWKISVRIGRTPPIMMWRISTTLPDITGHSPEKISGSTRRRWRFITFTNTLQKDRQIDTFVLEITVDTKRISWGNVPDYSRITRIVNRTVTPVDLTITVQILVLDITRMPGSIQYALR